MIGIHLRIQRQRDLEHLGAHVFKFGFGAGQHLLGSDIGFHDVLELGVIEFLAQPPTAWIRALT